MVSRTGQESAKNEALWAIYIPSELKMSVHEGVM